MASDTPRVSVLMVLADSGDGALDAARRALAAPECAELIVLDNASRDGIAQRLAREYADAARVRVLELGANLGFGAAMNRGAAVAQGDWLLLLNPDCLLAADSVSRLLDAAQGGALAGAIVCDARGRPDPAAWRRAPTLRRVLCMMSGLARHEQRWPVLAGVNRRDALPDATVAVEALSGALMLLPRAVFARVGGFDEGYFLHFEDLDLCARVRAAGTPLRLAGAVRVLHAKGGFLRRPRAVRGATQAPWPAALSAHARCRRAALALARAAARVGVAALRIAGAAPGAARCARAAGQAPGAVAAWKVDCATATA
ncbi:glycosyl transferase, group 2 family protein [mine drainage metagenome]|uniref:Glycosyl transferase, group 2 family protein n=1 Tax=mine drainage metagenome TaxID=410659 RepID=T1CHP5_9ZZZZ